MPINLKHPEWMRNSTASEYPQSKNAVDKT